MATFGHGSAGRGIVLSTPELDARLFAHGAPDVVKPESASMCASTFTTAG
jgi:hypothetical protein